MEQYFAKDYTGGSFVLFGPGHLGFILFFLLFNLSFIYLRRIKSETFRRNFRYGMAIASIVVELSWHIWKAAIGQWTVTEMLPLHLCSLFVILNSIMLFTRSYSIYEISYFLGIAGALQAFLTPDAGIYGLPHFRPIQTLLAHGLIITECVYMTVVEGFRPTLKSIWRVFLYGNIAMVLIHCVNLGLGSNYMYTMHKPVTASLLDMLGPWPWYLLAIEGIAVVMCAILYLPFAISDGRMRRLDRTVSA
jgi:hypothetical integral membrane protein (TIGR02206 family)